MYCTKSITKDLTWVGANDRRLAMFEGVYSVPDGVSYNSYLLMDDKTVLFDTVDKAVTKTFLENVKHVLGDRKLDYVIVHHMEPDHSASIRHFLEAYPDTTVVATAKAFAMISQFFDLDLADHALTAENGATLSLGAHELNFIFAPMVHWPEVMMTYDSTDKVLFSADAFGKFGALDVEEDWDCEARRYYIGIVGKYGAQVQNVLKKAAGLDIQTICPLHGPVLKDNLAHYIEKYNIWSSYAVESEGVMIAYTSVYGHTKAAACLLADKLKENGCPKVVVCDLARDEMTEAVEDAFRYGKLVLATTTYNADIFPFMKQFIDHLTERNYQNRTIGLIENGSWAPLAVKIMKGMFEKSKNITWLDTSVTIKSALNDDSRAQIEAMAKELCQ